MQFNIFLTKAYFDFLWHISLSSWSSIYLVIFCCLNWLSFTAFEVPTLSTDIIETLFVAAVLSLGRWTTRKMIIEEKKHKYTCIWSVEKFAYITNQWFLCKISRKWRLNIQINVVEIMTTTERHIDITICNYAACSWNIWRITAPILWFAIMQHATIKLHSDKMHIW